MARTTTPVTTLESWLTRATRGLCDEAAAQVRAEITEHYQSAIDSGASPDHAVQALGSPREANRQYRRALFTPIEAFLFRGLRNAPNFSVRLAVPVTLFGIGFGLIVAGYFLGTQGAIGKAGVLFTIAWLPIGIAYFLRETQPKLIQRRCLYYSWWTAVLSMLAMKISFGEPYWIAFLLAPCLWLEYTLMSIRRKVPRDQWPVGLNR
jgi:hypothetical protein